MHITDVKLNLADNTEQRFNIDVKTDELFGCTVYSVHGFSVQSLDAACGAEVEITLDGAESFMADFRHSECWCMPAFGEKLSAVPDETQGLVIKMTDGTFTVILPVVSEKYKCVLCGRGEKSVAARIFSSCDQMNYVEATAFVCASGEDPYILLKHAAQAALKKMGSVCRIREERRYPEVFEYLGWCSWDAMQIRVNEEDLIKKCEEFKQKNIPVKWAIIDDMWAEVHDFYGRTYKTREEMFSVMHASKLYSFEADPKRFPNGLAGCIEKMKRYGIKVGMWYPTSGYWSGVDPEGELFREQKDNLIKVCAGRYVPSWERDKAYRFYSAANEHLRKCGADFIKVDRQSVADKYYKNLASVGEAARNYHDAIEAAAGQFFDNDMINCMGMASEDMWNRSVSAISRCSDDFLPEDSAWFTKHIMQCSYNSAIQGQFYYCDWDMWWTDDGQAEKNSILRAISGGPIYVSDELNRSRREKLMPLITDDGRILRCDRPAMPTADCLTENPTESGRVFKLQNVCGDSGIMAVFNLSADNTCVMGEISPSQIHGLAGEEFAVYEHFSKKAVILGKNETLHIELNERNDYRLYVIVPVKDGFAPIGRTDKFISPKTIKHVDKERIYLTEAGEYAYVKDGRLIIKNE